MSNAIQPFMFISYASRDQASASLLVKQLEADGLRCFIAPRDIPVGHPWPRVIEKAVRDSAAFVLCFTANANGSDGVEREAALAVRFRKRRTVVRMVDQELGPGLLYPFDREQQINAYEVNGTPVDWRATVSQLRALAYAARAEPSPALDSLAERATTTVLPSTPPRQWKWLSPSSRFTDVEQLAQVMDDVRGTFGRRKDIEQLCSLVLLRPVVVLKGESGVGKTSVIERGLVPRLQQLESMHPVMVTLGAGEWCVAERRAATEAIWASLSAEFRSATGLARPLPDDFAKFTHIVSREMRRPVLLIFDEVNFYLALHHTRLVVPATGAEIDHQALLDANSFWRDLADLLSRGAIHVLLISHADIPVCLGLSASGEAPAVKPLEQLDGALLEKLFTRLERENLIDSPDQGWHDLRDALHRDLVHQSWVLPARISSALQGLAAMGTLSLRAYRRLGGLEGLEARYIGKHIDSAVRETGVSQELIAAALKHLMDPETHRLLAQPLASLAERARVPSEQTLKFQAVMSRLEERRIVTRVGVDDNGRPIWRLYHTFLAAGVIRLHETLSRFEQDLVERACLHDRARGVWKRWVTLLSPIRLAVVVFRSLSGRVELRQQRTFVFKSSLRLLPYVMLILLPIGLADAGLPILLGQQVRAVLDSHHLSILRPRQDAPAVLGAVDRRRRDLADLMMRRYHSELRLFRVGPDANAVGFDAWTDAQSIASMARANRLEPDAARTKAEHESLQLLFEDQTRLLATNGLPLGWAGEQIKHNPRLEPLAWAGSALAACRLNGHEPTPESWLAYVAASTERYLPLGGGWWNLSPLQLEKNQHSTYGTMLALSMMLDLREAALEAKIAGYPLDDQIERTFGVLLSAYDTSRDPPGWVDARDGNADTPSRSPGLTLQGYAVMLRANSDLPARCRLPEAFSDELVAYLTWITDDAKVNREYRAPYRYLAIVEDGKLGREDAAVTLLTYPWGIVSATRWLENADRLGASPAKKHLIRKRLELLLTELAPSELLQAPDWYTYKIAESLYAYTTAQAFLSRN